MLTVAEVAGKLKYFVVSFAIIGNSIVAYFSIKLVSCGLIVVIYYGQRQ